MRQREQNKFAVWENLLRKKDENMRINRWREKQSISALSIHYLIFFYSTFDSNRSILVY